MNTTSVRTDEITISGEQLVATLRKLFHEGNIRRVALKTPEGGTILEIPLVVGAIGALLLPSWAAVGAIAALVTDLRIVVERVEEVPEAAAEPMPDEPIPVIEGEPVMEHEPPNPDEPGDPEAVEHPQPVTEWR